MLDTSDEWITSRTGMKRRHISAPDQASSDLGIEAARIALQRANLTAQDIDCYIVASATPDYIFPATAAIIAAKLGATDKPAFDMEIGCSGFIYGLTVCAGLIRGGVHKRVMLIGAETLTKFTNYEDRGTSILFGDGAGAAILEASEIDSFLSSDLGSDGSNPAILLLPTGGSRERVTQAAIDAKRDMIYMNGREVFKFAVTKMIQSTARALEKAGLTKEQCNFLIPHQANKRIIDAASKYLEMPAEKVLVNIQEYGNTSCASVPLALDEALQGGKIHPGDIIVFVGFGAGLSWGAVTWRWQ